jgi:protein phosphatase
MGDQLVLAHVGDSRAYAFYLDGTVKVLSRDHSLVKRLEELGQITSDEAAVHPQRNVLYRALGQGEPFEPDINIYPLLESGFLMLCSDGLWGYVPEEKMLDIIRTAPTPELACHEMVKAANAAGGPDNITVVLVRLPS